MRAALFSVLSVATTIFAFAIDPLVAHYLSLQIPRAATETMLNILASSMLAVTTFSLSTMISGFSAATSNVTPRATPLVTEDRTAQNAISIFLGSFLFGVTSLVLMNLGVFGEKGSFALFVVTVVIMLWIVVTFLHWMDHLAALVRVDVTTARVERACLDAFAKWLKHPHFGGRPTEEWEPAQGFAVTGAAQGYVQHVDVGIIEAVAARNDTVIRLIVVPGSYVHSRMMVMESRDALDDGEMERLVEALTIADRRHFSNDPRFGMIVLAEVASRALSPAINDPGTAIAALAAGTRLLANWIEVSSEKVTSEPLHPHVYAPGLNADDLFDDLIRPIARDGAGLLEVAIRLQKMLGVLALAGDGAHAALARKHADAALERSLEALSLPEDKALLQEVARDAVPKTVP
nr:DUF2254 domain-containing protein [Hartmannibacter diazotrophicus]